jgi:hypothetical protein
VKRSVWIVEERGHRLHPWQPGETLRFWYTRKGALREMREQKATFSTWFFRVQRYAPVKVGG